MEVDRAGNLLGALAVALNDRLNPREPGQDGRSAPAAALVHLSHCERPTIESLRGVLGLSHSAAVRVADRLEASGLAVRVPDSQDARATALCLTKKGRLVAAEALAARAAALSHALLVLDAADKRHLEAIASKLLIALADSPGDLYRLCRLCDFSACSACPVAHACQQ